MDGNTTVALIVTVPPTLMAALAWWKSRSNAQTLGKKNGQGSLAEMSESLLLAFRQHAELDDIRFRELRALVRSENADTRHNTDTKAMEIRLGQNLTDTQDDFLSP